MTATMVSAYKCTLVVPTYNASSFIDGVVERLRRFTAEHPDWCVLFVCDGCKDDTADKLSRLIANDAPAIRAEVYTTNRGKGYAIRRGLSAAQTPYCVYTDVDLAYDPDEAVKLLEKLEAGADLAVVNRAHPESTYHISPRDFPNIYKRHLMSRSFNWWLRRMLPIEILDTQAGLKGISSRAWSMLSEDMQTDGFFFDVELLARATAAGLSVVESPIVFKYVDPTTVRMVSHGWKMMKDTLKLRRAMTDLKIAKDRVQNTATKIAPSAR